MIIHQAIYGSNSSGGHGLLTRSSSKTVPFQALATRTDLPGTPPPGVRWEAYLSGFSFQGYYVLARTFPDASAPRGGMVCSYVLLIDLKDIPAVGTLSSLIELLPSSISKPESLSEVTLGISEFVKVAQLSSDVVQLAELLVAPGQLPIVWIGQDRFLDSVVAIWTGMLPEMRSSFSFRLSFGPQDCQNDPPTIVCTPASLESRWGGYRVVQLNQPLLSRTSAAHLLLREDEGEALRGFANDIGANLSKPSDLRLLEQCWRYAERDQLSAQNQVAFARVLSHLSQDSKNGSQMKSRLADRLVMAISSMTGDEILSMRNLNLAPFEAADRILEAICAWAHLKSVRVATSDGAMAAVWRDAGILPATPWRKAILSGFDLAALTLSPETCDAIWTWWAEDPLLLKVLGERLHSQDEVENRLVATAPGVCDEKLAVPLMEFALRRRWLVLHGWLASITFDPATAIEKQLAVDTDLSYVAGVEKALGKASDQEILNAALRWSDSRLLPAAVQACKTSSSLIAPLDLAVPIQREIFTRLLGTMQNAWSYLANRVLTVDQLLTRSTRSDDPPLLLWQALAKTPLADLSGHANRQALWQNLHPAVLEIVLPATATGWLQRFIENPLFEGPPEADIRSRLVNEGIYLTELSALAPGRFENAVRFFSTFSEIDEPHFEKWLNQVTQFGTRQLAASETTQIGQLVAVRRWTSAAETISAKVKSGRSDLGPALVECYKLLKRYEQVLLRWHGRLSLPPMKADELWQHLEDLASELFQKGPNENEIWSRSGGDPSLLDQSGDGRSQWRGALRKLRQGGGGDLQAHDLLHQIKRDFSWNQELKWLAGHDIFQEK